MPDTDTLNPADPQRLGVEDERQLCPLSFAQERLWFLDQLQPGSAAYNISQAWRIEGSLDPEKFESAVNAVVKRQESLRTTFSRVEGKPAVVISAFRPTAIPITDLSTLSDPESELAARLSAAAERPFHLHDGPLFRVELYRISPRQHVVLFALHHIIGDASSFEILRREVTGFYSAACENRETAAPELPIQYLDFAHWQREQFDVERLKRDIDFWRGYLGGELPQLELQRNNPVGAPSNRGATEPFALSLELTERLRRIAQREGATLYTALLAGFTALLHRLTGQRDFVIGAPISGRDQTETENLIGFLVNTIPLRTAVTGNPTFTELLRLVRDSSFSAFAHHETPFDEIVKAVQPDRANGQNPLFEAVFALNSGFRSEWAFGPLRASVIDVPNCTAKFDLTFLLEESQHGIKGRLEYKTDQFEPDSAKRFLQHFQLLLGSVAENPLRRVSELQLLTGEDLARLSAWNDTTTEYERDLTIHASFEAQAARTPGAVALECGSTQLTYAELNARANQLGSRLKALGVGPDTLVGLALERSISLIVATLGILKAGGAYVPLDRSYPRERLLLMIRETGLNVIVSDDAFANLAASVNGESAPVRFVRVEDEIGGSDSEVNQSGGDSARNLAYVMFTSGSTGTPKAAAIPHCAVVRLVRNTNYATFTPEDVFLQLAPVSFDAATLEIWGALLNGAKLVIPPPQMPSLEELGRWISENRVTTLWLTAGLFHQMVDHQLDSLRGVRQLLAGGDVLSVPHVQKVLSELPECQLINGYGPTENTTFTCCYRVPKDWQGERSVPIGKPVSNTRVYVLDAQLQPVPIGFPGELYAAGDGLAREYLGQPLLTREKFIDWEVPSGNELSANLNRAAPDSAPPTRRERLYRTGDRVRWLVDGTLEFLGRTDQQLKIRGFRVEPAEIEAALMQHPNVRQAIVIMRPALNGERQLVGYVIPDAAADFDEQRLHDFLDERLPAFMVPTRFVPLGSFPLTPNGKVDWRALPAPDSELPQKDYVAPRNATEETLCGIWQELLGRNGFGVTDNFFQLGGHSLLVTQMISRIAKAFSTELPVRAVFETPTVEGLAGRLAGKRDAQTAAPAIIPRRRQRTEAQQLLTRIKELSDAEVESFLSRSK